MGKKDLARNLLGNTVAVIAMALANLGSGYVLGAESLHSSKTRRLVIQTARISTEYTLPILLRPIDSPLADAIFEPLLLMTPNFELRSNLVSSWVVMDDGRRIILSIRDGVYFHNGRKLEAADIEFSLVRAMMRQTGRFNAAITKFIIGSEKLKGSHRYTPGMCQGIKVLDHNRIELQFESPNPSFLFHLTHPITSPMPKEELTDDLNSWKNKPIGTGPYKVRSISVDNSRWELERFKHHYRASSSKSPDEVLLTSNTLDSSMSVIFTEHAEIGTKSQRTFERRNSTEGNPLVLFFVLSNAATRQTSVVRKGLISLVPRDEIQKALAKVDFVTHESFLPPYFWPKWSYGNLETDLTTDLKGLRIRILVRRSVPKKHPTRTASEIFYAALKKEASAKEVEIVEVDDPFAHPSNGNLISVFFAMPTFPFADPDNLRAYFGEDSPFFGDGTLSSPEVSRIWQILTQSRKSSNRIERSDLYREAMKKIKDEALGLPIAFRYNGALVDSEKIDPQSVFSRSNRLMFDEMVMK